MIRLFPTTSRRFLSTTKAHILLTTKEEYLNSTRNNNLFQFLQSSIDNGKLTIARTTLGNDGKSIVISKPLKDEVSSSDLKNEVLDAVQDTINSSNTLPLTTAVKSKIDTVGIPRWRLKPTLWFKTGHKLIKMYRDALQTSVRLYRNKKRINVSEIFRKLEFNQYDNLIDRSMLVENLIRVHEVKKLPIFALLLLVFEELTLLLMYWKPELALHRCLGLRAFHKLTNKYGMDPQKLHNISLHSYRSPYHLKKPSQLSLLKKSYVNTIPKWKLSIWYYFDVKDKLETTIADITQYLIVDDWLLLLKLIRDNQRLIINDNEFVNLILERNLYWKGEDLNRLINDPVGKKLLLNRLISYWAVKFHGIDLSDGSFKIIDKWGVNNINLLNFTGCVDEFGLQTLMTREKMLEFYREKAQLIATQ